MQLFVAPGRPHHVISDVSPIHLSHSINEVLLQLLLPVLPQQLAVVVVHLLVGGLLQHLQAKVLGAVNGAQRLGNNKP
jgi:hypothetical protein